MVFIHVTVERRGQTCRTRKILFPDRVLLFRILGMVFLMNLGLI